MRKAVTSRITAKVALSAWIIVAYVQTATTFRTVTPSVFDDKVSRRVTICDVITTSNPSTEDDR